ncbi:MAG: sensor histidine kinase [Egibacteraceae bacterium]
MEVLRRAHGLDVTLRVSGDRRRDLDLEREVFRVAQKALGNALRHARATTVAVEVTLDGPALVLVVRDDGVGFDPVARSVRARHLGLSAWLRMRSCCRKAATRIPLPFASEGKVQPVRRGVGTQRRQRPRQSKWRSQTRRPGR